MAITTTQPQKDERHTGRSLLLGIAVWFLHLNISYGLASLSCKWSWFSSILAGLTALQWLEIVVTLAALALMLVLVYLPWRDWRAFQTDKPADNPHLLRDTEKDRRSLVAAIVMLMNGFFCLFIIGLLAPIFALNACAHG